jgi:putative inorganic carbon (hco3(-)) transporter
MSLPSPRLRPAGAVTAQVSRQPIRPRASSFSLDWRALWRDFANSSPAFWFTSLYVFFEYVRPQSIYRAIDFAPWALLCLLGAVLFSVLEGRIRFSSGPVWGLFALFTVVIVASSLTAQYPAESWRWKDVWLNWMLLLLVVGAGVRTRTEFFLLLVGFTLWNVKMSQFGVRSWASAGFSFRTWGVAGAPGWFTNSGEFGIEMCIFGPIAGYMAYGLWPQLTKGKRMFAAAVVASALISIIASSSRGALIGAGAIGVWMVLRSPNRLRAIVIVAALSTFSWYMLPAQSKVRFSEMGTDDTSVNRLTYWEHGIQIANDHPLLGIGYKNWLPYYRARYNPNGELPHNFLVEAVSELGYVGLGVLLCLLLAFFVENARTRRRTSPKSHTPDRFLHSVAYGLDGAMIGFMASGSFVTVLYYPFIWMNLALCLALARVATPASRRETYAPRPPSWLRHVRSAGASGATSH